MEIECITKYVLQKLFNFSIIKISWYDSFALYNLCNNVLTIIILYSIILYSIIGRCRIKTTKGGFLISKTSMAATNISEITNQR